MTLDEAIRHAIEVAEKNEAFVKYHSDDRELGIIRRCAKCAEDHRQLAEWLEELKRRRNGLQVEIQGCNDDGCPIFFGDPSDEPEEGSEG